MICLLFFSDDTVCKTECDMQASGTIWLSNVHCDDNEPHIFYCRNDGWGVLKDGCPDTYIKDINLSCKPTSSKDSR